MGGKEDSSSSYSTTGKWWHAKFRKLAKAKATHGPETASWGL